MSISLLYISRLLHHDLEGPIAVVQVQDMKCKEPKVMIVNGDPFNSHSATGITMTNLFRGWDKARIAQVYMFDLEPEMDICGRYFRLTQSKLPVITWLRRLKKYTVTSSLASTKVAGASEREDSSSRAIQHSLSDAAAALADVIPFHLSKNFWTWVDECQPDVIYTQLVNIRLMNLVLQLADRLSIPVVPHFMDDWPSTRYRKNAIFLLPHHIMLSKIKAILKISPVGMTISDLMAKEYELRYGGRFETFMNCVEVPSYANNNGSADDAPVIFSYVGGLHLNRWRSLQAVGKALLDLKNKGLDVRAEVYSPSADLASYGKGLEIENVMQIKGTLRVDQVMPVLQSSDVLIHIESFEDHDRTYTRLSLSTKIPQYMASGKAILAYGPADVASCRYIEEQGCGLVVKDQNIELLSQAMSRLAKDEDLRNRLGRRGSVVASEKHNSVVERDKFRRIIESVASNAK